MYVVKNESYCEMESSQQIRKDASEKKRSERTIEKNKKKEHDKKNNDKEETAPRESEEIKKANKESVGREFLEITLVPTLDVGVASLNVAVLES